MTLEQRVEAIEGKLRALVGGSNIANNIYRNAAYNKAVINNSIDAIISNAIKNDSDTLQHAAHILG